MRGVQCTPRLVRLSVLSLFRLISSLGGVIRFPAITAAATFVCYRVGVSDDTEGRTHEAKLARKSHTNKLSTVRVIFPFVFLFAFFIFLFLLFCTLPNRKRGIRHSVSSSLVRENLYAVLHCCVVIVMIMVHRYRVFLFVSVVFVRSSSRTGCSCESHS